MLPSRLPRATKGTYSNENETELEESKVYETSLRGTRNFRNRNFENSSEEAREVGGIRSTRSNAGVGSQKNEEMNRNKFNS